MKVGEVDLKWLGHSGFLITNSKVVYIDPYKLKDGLPKADLILITHSHYDHCSVADMEKIVQDGTKIVMPADCQSKIARFNVHIKMEIIEPGQEMDLGDIQISALPAYNVDKHFHSKEEGWVGYLLKMHNVLIYHAGDSDLILEMQKLTGHKQPGKEFIALLPIGGRFTMNFEEAAEAAKLIKPTLVIPMHYGSIVGSEEDAKEFKEICEENNIKCEILGKE
jgi:L-ascorbate metabolism protein UlaG (beta-lactamase superfamily)